MNPLLQQSIGALALMTTLLSGQTQAQICPFDDGNSSLEVEGLILTRYALGITGAPLLASTGINAVDAPTVEAAINCPSCGLNITGNPTMTVADATIISRKLAGFSGAALTDNLALGSGTRNTPAAVQSFLLAGCGATGGTVTSITAGTGLTGGTITASGTLAADTTFLQRRVATGCAVGSFITAIGADGTPTCATPPSGAGGTVTSITAGTGLTGGTITANGTLAVNTAVIQSRISAICAAGSSIRAIAADGTVTCQTDTTGGSGTVTSVATGAGLSGGPISTTGTVNLTANQLLPTTACASGQIAKWNGSGWACAADDTVTNAFVQGGNSFASPAVLGTNDSQPVTVKTNQSTIKLLVNSAAGDDGLRISYETDGVATSANTINGSRLNSVAAGVVVGATIGGGGRSSPLAGDSPNQVNANYGTVGGGRGNNVTTTGVGGAIGGGVAHTLSGTQAVIGGGFNNTAGSAVAGNQGQTVAGGNQNVASGSLSTVPGGNLNTAAGDYSFAAGRRAKANHQGAFVLADSTNADAASTGNDQLVIRASGGVRLPGAGLNQPSNSAKQSGTNMFTHQVPVAGPCQSSGQGTMFTAIDHPLTNNNPAAILVVTPNAGDVAAATQLAYKFPVAVFYESRAPAAGIFCPQGRWVIHNAQYETVTAAMVSEHKFNVLVINP